LNQTAEQIGSALGQVAGRIDRWKRDQASIAADLRGVLHSLQGMLHELGPAAGAAPGRSSGGRPKGFKASPETRAKLRAAWDRRRQAASSTGSIQPVDQRGIIRSKAPRTWSNRQSGRG
jgi:hypothetical protein